MFGSGWLAVVKPCVDQKESSETKTTCVERFQDMVEWLSQETSSLYWAYNDID